MMNMKQKKRFVESYSEAYVHEWFIDFVFNNDVLIEAFVQGHMKQFEQWKDTERKQVIQRL